MKKQILKKIVKNSMTAGVLCTLFCSMTACKSEVQEKSDIVITENEEEMTYPIATVEYGNVVKNARISCTYTPTEHEELAFLVEDRLVEKVNIKKGDIVEKGDLLVALDIGELEDKIEELSYQVEMLKLKQEHTTELKEFDLNAADTAYGNTKKTNKDKENWEEKRQQIETKYHDTLEDLQDSISLNTKRLEKYQEELAGGQLIAGISGEITYLLDPLLDKYSEKDVKVVTISNLDSCYFIADDMTYADYFKAGESYQVVYKVSGEESYVEVTPYESESWQEQMLFKAVNEEIIESGLQGTISMELEKKTQVLCIPNSALHEATDGMFVYVWENDLLAMRYVEIGLQGSEMTEIVGGLEQGESVVLK